MQWKYERWESWIQLWLQPICLLELLNVGLHLLRQLRRQLAEQQNHEPKIKRSITELNWYRSSEVQNFQALMSSELNFELCNFDTILFLTFSVIFMISGALIQLLTARVRNSGTLLAVHAIVIFLFLRYLPNRQKKLKSKKI